MTHETLQALVEKLRAQPKSEFDVETMRFAPVLPTISASSAIRQLCPP
jgi:hypothetical protein